ncbi:MAG: HIT family protein [Gammaproteobacteria bacterium]|nr:HIT family protein [Gammaproteobacteria bacterium]
MVKFVLDPRLEADCIRLGELELSLVLLMNSSLVPWFILVPKVEENEICLLTAEQQNTLYKEINILSEFVCDSFETDKLNIGTIGNIVNQLHVHVVGRRKDDYCWPGVVWGEKEKRPYSASEIENIRILASSIMANGKK